jgi:FlaA1/EpsC-like NDP-sugar epimerase
VLLRYLVSIAFDLSVAALAFIAAFVTVYGYPRVLAVPAIEEKVLGFVVASIGPFLFFAPYRGSWRYVSITDLILIFKAAFAAVTIFTVGSFLLTRGQNIPRSVPVLSLIYMVMLLAGGRLTYRLLREKAVGPSSGQGLRRQATKVLLCGLSDKAENFSRSARSSGRFTIVGIIDDSSANLGRTVHGLAVLGDLDHLEKALRKLKRRGITVAELIVTETAPTRERLATIVERANAASLKISRIPDITDTAAVTSELLLEPRPVELSDLLERPEVTTNPADISRLIAGKVVMATGAGGSIGSELSRQIAALRPKRLIITDHSEYLLYTLDIELRDAYPDLDIVTRILDVRDAQRVLAIMREFTPEIVLHAAALKHVPLMEENPLEAVKTNVLGTRNVADAAVETNVSAFLMISTDKAVHPTNVMGATKRAAEAYCQSLDIESPHTRFKTVRFGNVLGSNGSVVPRFQEQIAAGGPVTVTHPDVVRYFMTIPEAVQLILQACAHALERKNDRGNIMVLDMGKPVRIADLAERMIQLAGYRPKVDIDIVFTGLRPGEKLYEELFSPSELLHDQSEDGYVIAAPRVIDRPLLARTIAEIEVCAEREDTERVIDLLCHIVPEYQRGSTTGEPPVKETL